VAVAVFTIGMVGVTDLISQSRRIHHLTIQHFQATVVAESQLAALRVAGPDALRAEVAAERPQLPLGRPATVDGLGGFAWEVSIEPAAGVKDAYRVAVTVSWNTRGKRGRHAPPLERVTLTELIGQAAPASGGEAS